MVSVHGRCGNGMSNSRILMDESSDNELRTPRLSLFHTAHDLSEYIWMLRRFL